VAFLSELHALGIDLFLHQQGLDTTTPAGKAMFQMLGVFAEFKSACALAYSGPSVKVNDLAGRRSRTSWLSESEQLWRVA
jgi:Resolvase, N terminal domain